MKADGKYISRAALLEHLDRCKDCAHYCRPDDFCSLGVRKDV